MKFTTFRIIPKREIDSGRVKPRQKYISPPGCGDMFYFAPIPASIAENCDSARHNPALDIMRVSVASRKNSSTPARSLLFVLPQDPAMPAKLLKRFTLPAQVF
jgi:hypothetical protein